MSVLYNLWQFLSLFFSFEKRLQLKQIRVYIVKLYVKLETFCFVRLRATKLIRAMVALKPDESRYC
jgi:hypothetical protein